MFKLTYLERTIQTALDGVPRDMHQTFTLIRQVARMKAADMAVMDYYNHVSPTYGVPDVMYNTFCVSWWTMAENIAFGDDPAIVMASWIRSPPHKAAILEPVYALLGCGWMDPYNV